MRFGSRWIGLFVRPKCAESIISEISILAAHSSTASVSYLREEHVFRYMDFQLMKHSSPLMVAVQHNLRTTDHDRSVIE